LSGALNPTNLPNSALSARGRTEGRSELNTVDVYNNPESLPSSCQRLFAEATHRSVFHSLPWYRNFAVNALTPGESVRIYAVMQNGESDEAAAVLPMRCSGNPIGALPGRGLRALTNYYSSLYAPLCADPEAAQAPLQAIADHIASERPRWDVVEIQPLDPADPVFSALEEALRKGGFLVDRYFCFGNWYLEVGTDSFKDYFPKRPKKLSQNAPRSRRKLEASGRMRLDIVTSRSGLDEAKAAYHTIYNSSWKQQEPFPGFIDGLLDLAAELGWLRLGVIHIDGIPAAAQIWFVTHGTASIFKMAYDSKFTRESVGTVLSSYLMEHVIDIDKVRVVDYLSGDDAYKRDWMSHRRERWGLIAYNPRTIRGLFAATRHFGGRMLRRLRPKVAAGPTGDKGEPRPPEH
jgi:CelD/BcsL family acetyltransferase involved in cellulose biosynthesis